MWTGNIQLAAQRWQEACQVMLSAIERCGDSEFRSQALAAYHEMRTRHDQCVTTNNLAIKRLLDIIAEDS